MTDEQQDIDNAGADNAQVEKQEQQPEQIDYKAWYEENKPKVENAEGILAKNRELLGKMAKTKEQKEAVQKQLLEQEGNFEKLYRDQQQKIRNKTIEGLSKELGLKYAGDVEAAEALTELVERRVSELVNEDGDYDVNDIEELKLDIETNKKYARLLGDRNKGVGSGAQGNVKTTNQRTVKLSEMSEKERLDLFRNDNAKYRALEKLE